MIRFLTDSLRARFLRCALVVATLSIVNATAVSPAVAAVHAQPSAPTVTATTSTTISLSWSAYSGTGRYYVTYALTPASAQSYFLLPATSKSYTITGLKPNTAYVVSLNAGVDGQWSVESNWVNAKTAPDAATADPLTIAPPALTVNSATIAWLGAVPGATSYVVTASADPNLAAGVATVSKTLTAVAPVTFADLALARAHYFRVTAMVNGVAKNGPVLTATTTTGVDKASTPGPSIFVPGVHTDAYQPVKGQAGLIWTSANVGAVDFWRVSKMGTTPAGLDYVIKTATVSGTPLYTESSLTAGTVVRYRVQNCWGTGGCSQYSTEFKQTVK